MRLKNLNIKGYMKALLPVIVTLAVGTSLTCSAASVVYPKEAVAIESVFVDIKEENQYRDYVYKSVELGFMKGYTPTWFGVNDTLTRAQLAQVLYNSYSQGFIGTNTRFIDVNRSDWFAPAVAWVSHYGIMNGRSEDQFYPSVELTKEQVIKTLYNLADEPETEEEIDFLYDYEEISDYAKEPIAWALKHGIVSTIEDRIGPKEKITRGELSQLLVYFNDYVMCSNFEMPLRNIPDLQDLRLAEFLTRQTVYEPHNRELQDYLPEQVRFSDLDNEVIITANKLYNGNYESGKIKSAVSFRYGIFEFEFNNLAGQGYWPAIWMLPDSKRTRFPELDIYEMVGDQPNVLYGTLHHFAPEDSLKSGKFVYNSDVFRYTYDSEEELPPKTTIRLDWTPDALIWTINGEEVNRITHDVPDNYMYLVINLAIGGNWPGDPAPDTVFPAKFRTKITRFEPVEYKYRGD